MKKKKNKTRILMNKLVYLGLSILELNKILMYEFCYDYTEPKYGEKVKLCYMNTEIICIKSDEIYKDIAEDAEDRFDTPNMNWIDGYQKERIKK